MEKRSSLKFFFLFFSLIFFAQKITFSQNSHLDSSTEKIRICLWALQDAYPENQKKIEEEHKEFFFVAKNHLENLTEFLLCGMTYGWKFSYTPSDKLRGVEEFFECVPLHSFENDKKNVHFEKPFFKNEKIYCWVNFFRTPQMNLIYNQYNSIKNPRIKGSGQGKLSTGFEGLQTAAFNSIKNGVREYFRKIIKNKPKEISGTLLIKNVSAIYIENGNYVVELDFFLETSKIKEYNYF